MTDTDRAADEYRAAIRYDTLRETGAEIVTATDLGILEDTGAVWLTKGGEHLTDATDYDRERWAADAWVTTAPKPPSGLRAERSPF